MRRAELRRPGLREALAKDPGDRTRHDEIRRRRTLLARRLVGLGDFAVGVDQPDLVADFPVVRTLMERALQIDEDYADGAIHEVFITLDGMSASMGGDAARARKHFERAVELSKGKSASAYVAMAASVAQPANDKEEFEKLLEQALAVNPDDVPNNRLATLIAQKRARILQSRVDELFTDAAAHYSGGTPSRRWRPPCRTRPVPTLVPLTRLPEDTDRHAFQLSACGSRRSCSCAPPPCGQRPDDASVWPRRRRSGPCGTRRLKQFEGEVKHGHRPAASSCASSALRRMTRRR